MNLGRSEILKIVKDAVVETFDLKEKITNDNLSFVEDLDADSIDLASLVMVLEDEFSADIEEEKVRSFVTINDVVDFIVEQQKLQNIKQNIA
ncbi:MAG: acyl carrier protein [Cocleimonas sp.]